ncbi:CLUMA_CG007630, isoform A [Clunio marinus]|uniref:CLUMA_CG007630, isoform A n=1 Tax=Clunio marinus TaxID=568069 RepID=A0A1J1I1L7_9DIPT|nr:CLUMA_CG007630, isoform A [Clunio marinus]
MKWDEYQTKRHQQQTIKIFNNLFEGENEEENILRSCYRLLKSFNLKYSRVVNVQVILHASVN